MSEDLIGKLLVGAVAGGFGLLTAVIGFFARRLVHQQDKHSKVLGIHDRHIERLDVRVGHLEGKR